MLYTGRNRTSDYSNEITYALNLELGLALIPSTGQIGSHGSCVRLEGSIYVAKMAYSLTLWLH